MPHLPDVVTWSIPGFLLLIVVEVISYRFHGDDDELGYDRRDTTTSLTMGLGSVAFDILWKIPIVAAYALVYELTPLRIELTWWTFPLLLLAQDFFYYWSHRSHHVIRVLWASHVVHHSSQRFNLSTALRQTRTGATSWVFYLPMIIAGVHPGVLAFCQSINLVYQFWIHTERMPRLRYDIRPQPHSSYARSGHPVHRLVALAARSPRDRPWRLARAGGGLRSCALHHGRSGARCAPMDRGGCRALRHLGQRAGCHLTLRRLTIPADGAVVMATYTAGQALIVLGVLAASRRLGSGEERIAATTYPR